MSQRITFQELPPEFINTLYKVHGYVDGSGLPASLRELIYFRVSIINHCGYCLDMHWKDAIAGGETPQRLYSLAAWQECPYYTDKERAALAFADALTHASHQEVGDELYETLLQHFTKAEIAHLTMAVVEINAWNRVNKVFRTTPGFYKRAE